MKIGIDARTLCAHKTGDRSYALGLLHGLARIDSGHRFVLYFDQPPPPGLPTGPEWEARVIRAVHPRLWTLSALPRAARADGVDVLHVQYSAPPCRVPRVVTTVHDVTFRLHPEWFTWKDRTLLDRGLRASLRTVAAVLTVSDCTRRDLQRLYGLAPERICVAHNALPPGFHEPLPADVARVLASHSVTQPYVLFVGVLQPRKNLPRTIRAFLAVRRACNLPHRLAVVGKVGWRSEETLATLKHERPGEAVQLVGYVPDEDLPALYSGADAFLFPTLYEGFGIPVLEAFALGIPVITSDVSALPEVAGDAALLVDPLDEAAIAEALTRVLSDPALRQQLTAAGRKRVQAFSWDETARRTIACYEQAVRAPECVGD